MYWTVMSMVSPVPPVQKGYNSYHLAQAHKQLGRSASTGKISCITRPTLPDYDFIEKLSAWIFVAGGILIVALLGGAIGQ